MAWRKIQVEDIKRGTVIRMSRLEADGGYCMATIIAIHADAKEAYPHVKVARPYAYAHEHFNAKEPLMGAEVFAIGIQRMLEAGSDVEVFQGRDAVRSMVT
jgi:hypothetical protein